MVRSMHDDSRPVSELREALNAVRATGSIRGALNGVYGTAPEPEDPADGFVWDASPPPEPWPRRLARANWILIFTIVGSAAAVVGVIIAYLALVKPN
jgi:hypothetical protein